MECSNFILNGKQLEGFKVKFDIRDYGDLYNPKEKPSIAPKRVEEIINWNKEPKYCVWKRVVPDVITERYKQQEIMRCLKTGVWIFIKNMPVWLPPSYYFFLQYFRLASGYPKFRIKRLKQVYEKLRVRNDPRYIGMYTIKNRQDGETSITMSDALLECAIGNMDFGSIGMQSKTRDTVVNSCWRVLTMGWNSLDKWVKDVLYSDFVSGDKIAEKMKFVSTATDTYEGRDVMITYGASTHNAFDSMNNMRRCILDEVNKVEEGEGFYATFLNYEKFIAPGSERRGVFDILSSPADTSGKHNDEAFSFWKGCDPDELNDIDTSGKYYYAGVTHTRIRRYYSDPLDGIEGFYDEFGDADADEIYKWIIQKRKSIPKANLMSEIRGYPLNEQEMFGSTDQLSVWSNTEGILARKLQLQGLRFKNEKTKEPVKVFGNLEWRDGIVDSEVDFRMSDKSEFDVVEARFCFSYLPQNKEPLKYVNGIPQPPSIVQSVTGIDPIDKNLKFISGSRVSNAAMVNQIFTDIYETGIVKCPAFIYSNRPQHPETFYEDAIKACVFSRSMVQVESLNSKIIDYFDDRGYINWMLSKIGQPRNSLIKGDAPSGGKNAFLDEVIQLINAITNTPVIPTDKYHLEQNWFIELLDDVLAFNPKETHKNDLTMAWGQALIGAVKILHKKVRQKHPEMAGILSYMLD